MICDAGTKYAYLYLSKGMHVFLQFANLLVCNLLFGHLGERIPVFCY